MKYEQEHGIRPTQNNAGIILHRPPNPHELPINERSGLLDLEVLQQCRVEIAEDLQMNEGV